MERFIVGAQKSTNQLKAVLAKLLPTAGAGSGSSGSAVDALLSDITDSLSQALASLRFGALDTQRPPATGQSSTGGGGRRSAPRRSGQRFRMEGACRMVVLQNGVQDSYTWRKYGQKDILGARFPRSYFKCGRKSGCPAKKHVQQTDADPSKLEITYLDAHTCDDPAPPPSSSSHAVPDPVIISSGTEWSAARLVPVVAAVQSAERRYAGQPSPLLHPVPDLMAGGTNDPRTAGAGVLLPAAAAGVPAAMCRTEHDPVVPDDTPASTPSMEEEEAEKLFIPSPACSQSELLLPAEDAKGELHGPPDWNEYDVDERQTISDLMVVPELSIISVVKGS